MIPETSSVPRARLHCLRRGQARFSVASLAGLLALSSLAHAEERASSQRPARREGLPADMPRRPGPLQIFDTDRDGAISAAEIEAAPEVLRRLDKNGDGRLSGDELRPRPPRRPDGEESDPEGMPPPPREP